VGHADVRPDGLHQPHDREVVPPRIEDVAVQLDAVRRCGQDLGVEEGELDPVAGGEHHEVGPHPRPVDELDLVAVEPGDHRLDRDPSPAELVEDVLADRRVRAADGVVGLGEPEARHRPVAEAQEPGQDGAPDRERDPRVVRVLVQRDAEQELRQDVVPAAGRQRRRASDLGRLRGDVHRAVAEPEHDHVAVAQLLAGGVVVGVDDLAVELARQLGHVRDLVVAVGGDEQVVPAGLAGRELEVPAAVGSAVRPLDGRLEAVASRTPKRSA
jgi:hypothetical protein